MIEKNIKALILKKEPQGEFNEILTILTSKGKLKIFAPGVRKLDSKNRNNINLLDISELEIIDSQKSNVLFYRLKRASLVQQFSINLNTLYIWEDLLNILNKIMLNNPLQFLNSFSKLTKLVDSNKDIKILDYLLFKLLETEGIAPYMQGCVECKAKTNLVDFKFYKGGFLCHLHSEDSLDHELLTSLFYLSKSFEEFDVNTSFLVAKKIKDMIITYLREYYFI